MDDGDVLKVKRLRPGARLPERATEGSSGLDLFACIEEPGYIVLGRQPVRVGTGIAIEFPRGFDVQVRPRSGLSTKGCRRHPRHHRQRLPGRGAGDDVPVRRP